MSFMLEWTKDVTHIIPGVPKKNGTLLNGSITVIFQPISIKLAELNVKVLNDTHTKKKESSKSTD